MPNLPLISAKKAIKAFEKIGYQVIRQRGSHIRTRHKIDANKQPITILTTKLWVKDYYESY
ncbi:MAG: type II toxin-antitoxin system HicA family toxin [Candidatus Omnitrophota bacterium]